MKKYRYGDSGPGFFTKIRRYNLLYLFMAWNVFGYGAYKYLVKDKSEEWKNLGSTKKYISLMTNNDQEIKVIKIKSTGILTETGRVEDFVVPDPPKPRN